MIIRFLILICAIAQLGNCCSIVTTDVKTELKGEGFHRQIHTTLELSSLKRLIDCKVSYYFQIPKGAYLDTDALNVSLIDHCFLSTPFNTEVPANHPSLSDNKPIIFQSKIELRKVFMFSDELQFPVHLRYHEPSNSESGLSDPIVFPPPKIYLHCKDNSTLMAEETCRSNIEKLACSCKSRPKCDFFRLSYKNSPESLKAQVPIGKLWQATFVTYSTIVFVLALVFWTIFASFKQSLSTIDESDKKTN